MARERTADSLFVGSSPTRLSTLLLGDATMDTSAVDCVAIAANYWYMSQVTEVAGLIKYLVSDYAVIRSLACAKFEELQR